MNSGKSRNTSPPEERFAKESITWVGTGNMGFPMVSNLIASGWPVTVYNRTPERARPLLEAGGRMAGSLSEAISNHRIVVTMLQDDEAVRTVCESPSGILDGLVEGGIHISMGTLSPTFVEKLTRQHAQKKQTLVSAPVFGRPDRAQSATLTIVTAGPKKTLELLDPLFRALGSTLYQVGENPAQANWVKILGNFTLGGLLETLAETLSLSRKVGIPPETLVEILNTALYRSPVFQNYGNLMARESYQPAGFHLKLGLKDMRLVSTEADRLEVPLPLADLLRSGFLAGVNRGYGEWDWSALSRVRDEDAGSIPDHDSGY
ncbi:MAG: NAD(P)-dependent oxidoreductase [Leptospirales bacterium]